MSNQDTGLGLPLWHENRCVGKALYAIRLESCHDDTTLTGTNTTRVRPIELNVKVDPNSVGYPRDSTMFIFLHHDFYI